MIAYPKYIVNEVNDDLRNLMKEAYTDANAYTEGFLQYLIHEPHFSHKDRITISWDEITTYLIDNLYSKGTLEAFVDDNTGVFNKELFTHYVLAYIDGIFNTMNRYGISYYIPFLNKKIYTLIDDIINYYMEERR